MTTMKKGFVAMFLLMVLAIGTVASANSKQTAVPAKNAAAASFKATVTSPQSAETAQRVMPEALPAPAERRVVGATLSITELTNEVADDHGAHVSVHASGVLRNTSKTAINLREVQALLKDAEGKVAILAQIETVGESSELLKPGEEIKLRLTYNDVPVDGGALRMALVTPVGGAVVNSISISIHCTWSPLRCRIDIKFDL